MPARGTQIFANVDKNEIKDAMIGDLYLSPQGLIEKYNNSQTWEPAFNLSTAASYVLDTTDNLYVKYY